MPELGQAPSGEFIVQVTENWVVAVVPMIFNDRICIASHEEYGRFWTAGWCFARTETDSILTTIIEGARWDPEVDRAPQGFIKEAFDRREGSLL